MKLVANRVNGVHLRDVLPIVSDEVQVDRVLAAIAYGNSASDETKDLVGNSISNGVRLDLWMRYDHTVPVSIELLERLLESQSSNVFSRFIPDSFHPKVVWWKGYGAYIGSANHTDRGWLTNIEVGIFLGEDELVANGLDVELDGFFDYLKDIDVSIPISEDLVKEMRLLAKANYGAYEKSRKIRSHEFWHGPSFLAKKAAVDRRREAFRKEWMETLGILRNIQGVISEYRPSWVHEDVPEAWQVDQFLHAYYYNRVGDKLRKPYDEYYEKNKRDPVSALKAELEWWCRLPNAPYHEDENLYGGAPIIRDLLKKDKVVDLTVADFELLCRKTHATMDHVIKVPLSILGRPDLKSMNRDERVSLFADMVMKERNSKGWDVRQLLSYVLYGGKEEEMWSRIYDAGREPSFSIPRYGLNSIAEVVGWARPEVAPPRNGRTSKALRALGYDVKVY